LVFLVNKIILRKNNLNSFCQIDSVTGKIFKDPVTQSSRYSIEVANKIFDESKTVNEIAHFCYRIKLLIRFSKLFSHSPVIPHIIFSPLIITFKASSWSKTIEVKSKRQKKIALQYFCSGIRNVIFTNTPVDITILIEEIIDRES